MGNVHKPTRQSKKQNVRTGNVAMYNELIVKIGLKDHRVFLKNGFYSFTVGKPPLHKHNYAEIHIVTGGTVMFHIGESLHSSVDGNLVIIPSDVFHYIDSADPDARHTAFQVDYDVHNFAAQQISMQTAIDFMEEIERCQETKNYAVVSAYISLFCSRLYPELRAYSTADYSFLIREFFSNRYYEDLRLCDLAKELHLSERQTERLVIKNTKHTFSEELVSVRMSVAKYLLSTTDLSKEEISRRVGYQSYAGFWKAMKKHTEQAKPE